MTAWNISIPVWGERYLSIFERAVAPALRLAVASLGQPVDFLIHTDNPARVSQALMGLVQTQVKTYPVLGTDNSFGSLSECHRHAINMAPKGSKLVLLTADLVLSSNSLKSCEAYLTGAGGKRLVCVMGLRCDDKELPPLGVSGPELMEWAWNNRHPMTRECTWPEGRSYDIWRMYFEKDDNVVARIHLPHPLAMLNDGRKIRFAPTIDVNVIQNYKQTEMCLITDPNQVVMLELSPTNKEFVMTETMRHRFDHRGPSCPEFIRIAHRHHRWFFSQAIRIKGSGNAGDGEVVTRMLGNS